MGVVPKNRHMLVEVVETVQSVAPSILVPDDYVTTNAYELVKVLASSSTCCEAGQYAIVDSHMIKNVSVLGQDHQLVLENYVLAVVTGVKF